MKNRDTSVICWELLRAMSSGPQKPTRLARLANVPYDRLGEYMSVLKEGGLVQADSAEGHDTYSLTPRGMEALGFLDAGLRMLFPAFE